MNFTVSEIAKALDAVLFGDGDIVISGASEPASAGVSDLALAMDPKYADGLASGSALAAIVWEDADWQSFGLKAALVVPRARYAMSGLTALMDSGPEIEAGVHPSAVIHETAIIGCGVAIGPLAVIGARSQIGTNARIAAHVYIAEEVEIGDSALIHSGVRISARVRIGDRFICQPGAVIGGDGFSFVTPEKSRVEDARQSLGKDANALNASWTRIHSLGSVKIGDDVEVGANTCIDAGTIRATQIGNRTKLDNLVQIGHNVIVGDDTLLCAQVGIAGSTTIGDRVVMGGQCGVSDNIFVGDDVVAGGASKMMSKVPAGRVVLGYPAMKMDQYLEASRNWRRLPRMLDDIKALKKSVSNQDGDD
ncbi:MAG: UDP-3-O-(3-hydroxymyristoyl)glucosamine N-acyltransferase [Boseongicola sp.]|nr:MAG: UDP-3-O-(3-hydroxymyristoyl)glucosamine N-acyltransferase [Boseongicola sp.]